MSKDQALLWAYWACILLYSLLVLFLGWRGFRSSRDEKSNTAFWAAGRKLGAWSTGLSISASFMSISWSCVYAVQLVYWYGLSSLWLLAVPWLVVMCIYYVLTPYFRRLPAFSQPEMIAQRFGASLRAYLALPLAFVFVVWGGAEIYAAAQILSPILHLPFHLILAFVALVVAGYSYMGGFSAVVSTDKVQFVLVAFFITAIAWVAGDAALSARPLHEVISTIPAPAKTQQSAWAILAAGPALIFMTVVAYLPGWIVETDIWLRLQAARSDKAARLGILIATVNSVLFIAIFPMLIGLAALSLYPPAGSEVPEILNDGAAIFAVFIDRHASAGLGIMLIGGLAAASMSTIDTCGNVVALSLSYDLIEPGLNGHKFKRKTVARLSSAAAVGVAYVYALFTESLWDVFYLSSGILTTTIAIPMLALFLKSSNATRVRRAAVVGFLATLGLYFLEKNGGLQGLQPEWLAETELGYIVWALLGSFIAYISPDKGKGG